MTQKTDYLKKAEERLSNKEWENTSWGKEMNKLQQEGGNFTIGERSNRR